MDSFSRHEKITQLQNRVRELEENLICALKQSGELEKFIKDLDSPHRVTRCIAKFSLLRMGIGVDIFINDQEINVSLLARFMQTLRETDCYERAEFLSNFDLILGDELKKQVIYATDLIITPSREADND